jgi:hypothetical protein
MEDIVANPNFQERMRPDLNRYIDYINKFLSQQYGEPLPEIRGIEACICPDLLKIPYVPGTYVGQEDSTPYLLALILLYSDLRHIYPGDSVQRIFNKMHYIDKEGEKHSFSCTIRINEGAGEGQLRVCGLKSAGLAPSKEMDIFASQEEKKAYEQKYVKTIYILTHLAISSGHNITHRPIDIIYSSRCDEELMTNPE